MALLSLLSSVLPIQDANRMTHILLCQLIVRARTGRHRPSINRVGVVNMPNVEREVS